MRESEYIIDNEALKAGLIAHRASTENSPGLEELMNLRCASGGLVPVRKLPIFSDLGDYWPAPKILSGPSHDILVDIDDADTARFYTIQEDLSLTLIQSVGSVTPLMHHLPDMADFEEFIVVVGDFGVLHGTPDTGYTYSSDALANIPLARTCCNFRGQLVLGSITSDWYGCGESSVAWSRIGEVDCTPTPNNEAGFMPIKDAGTVLKVRPSASGVLVFGDTGVFLLPPVSSPAPTFGKNKISSMGVLTREAVDGDELEYVFVGVDKNIYKIDSEGLHSLGYYRYIKDLESSDIKVRFDKLEREYYISDGVRCFLLTSNGLSEIGQIVGELLSSGGLTYGVLDESDAVDEWWIRTGPVDFYQRGMKTLMMVDSDVDDAYVSVLVKNKGGDYISSPVIKMNPWNATTHMITGQVFKVMLEGDLTPDVLPSYVKIRWKMVDFRSIRGRYVQ